MKDLTEEMWPCHHVPEAIICDWGELKSHKAPLTGEQIWSFIGCYR